MPVFAVEYTYDDRTAERDAVRPEHRAFLRALHETGALLASGPFEGGASALLVVVAADDAAARDLLTGDPFAAAGLLADVRVRPWSPVIGVFAHLV
ncbi:MAG TPA: hypothetical protein DHV14_08100 [Micrococcales bacterium]|uniref:YCII-related domain-containing protein n=1 Tax=Miniimonas arenae TaxID=676201 RepID=A0A5C5BEM8_9MICO|nr:YciI family protein [Miniimonas arenae]TNU77001.1 hypothetical protein FH969_01235 [Miniimonas arenae]HCX85080.1 hypothetical protein [Micrococcales bacterium]